jgi:hypothetical protein
VVPAFASDIPELPVRSGELLANLRLSVVDCGPVQVLTMLGSVTEVGDVRQASAEPRSRIQREPFRVQRRGQARFHHREAYLDSGARPSIGADRQTFE